MIWHIFKKDWKLMWRLVVGVALVHFTIAAVLFKMRFFGGTRMLATLVDPLLMIAMVGTGFLLAAVIHQDAIPGVRQDWLVRPVKRRDLLLAKLLFVLLLVHGPILAADLTQALANGFPLGESLAAAVSRSFYIFLGFSLPLLALASLTLNFTEGIVGGLAIFLCGGLFMMVIQRDGRIWQTAGTGVGWVPWSTWLTLTLLGSTAVLVVQYFRRKTMPGRWLIGATALLCLCTGLIPWQTAFAIQQRRAPIPGAAGDVRMTFEPHEGKFRSRMNLDDLNRRSWFNEGDVFVYIPLRISGLADDTVLKADRSEVRVTGPSGKTEYLGPGNNLEIRQEGHSGGEKQTYYGIHVGSNLFNSFKDQPVRMEIDYSLTLFRLVASHALPAMNGDQRMPNVGWCKTKLNETGTSVQLRCLEAGVRPSCGTMFLEHAPSGRRNPPRPFCSPDYSPYLRRDFPDAMGRFGFTLPFVDPSGLAQYPVEGAQLAKSQVVLRIYRQVDHFTRRLEIPEVRLKDWESGLSF